MFFDKPIHTTEVERFQEVILKECGFAKKEEQRWIYFPPDFDPERPVDEQDYTIVETLTALGEGKMLKAIFSMQPLDLSRHEMPYSIEKILSRKAGDPQTDEDFKEAEKLVMEVEKNKAEDILRIAEVDTPLTEPDSKEAIAKIFKKEPRVRFTTPLHSPEMDKKTVEMLCRILKVPCLTKCLDTAISQSGVYRLRANIVTTLACMDYTREEIAYLFREIINNDIDNANRGELEYQVDHWYRKKYHSKCDWFQEVANEKFCCEEPCGRRNPAQLEPSPEHIQLTRTEDFKKTYDKCEEIIDSGKPLILCPKTTRAGFTTALNIVAREKGKKILFLVPRTSISEETFRDTICLAREKRGIFINGFVLSANQKSCLTRMKEAIEYEKTYNKPMEIEIPVPRDDCAKCPYRGTIVTPPLDSPLFESDPEHDACHLETYRAKRETFDSGFLTYNKIYAILNTPSEDAKEMLKDIERYDTIVFDEITQFVEVATLKLPVELRWRETETPEKPTYKYFSNLNKDMENIQKAKGLSNTEEKIHEYVSMFIEKFSDTEKYKHSDKISNPMTVEERNELKLNMILYLAFLYNYFRETDDGHVKTLYDALTFLSEEYWYAEKLSTMEHVSEINFIVPPKNKMVVDWVKGLKKQVIITDAVLPYQDLKEVFGPELEEMPIGDPQETAKTQLVISDSRSIKPTALFADTNRLIEYVKAVIDLHGIDRFMVACPNHSTAKEFADMFSEIPKENITYYRSNKTIGVPCNHRVMIAISTPYAPDKAFDWAAKDIKGEENYERESKRFWKVNARNTYFQTIGRAKDPVAKVLSVVYAYGVKVGEIENLLKDCQGKPNIIETPAMREISNAHTTVGNYWLHSGDCGLSPNEIKAMTHHSRGLDPTQIAANIGVDSKLIESAIEKFTSAL